MVVSGIKNEVFLWEFTSVSVASVTGSVVKSAVIVLQAIAWNVAKMSHIYWCFRDQMQKHMNEHPTPSLAIATACKMHGPSTGTLSQHFGK